MQPYHVKPTYSYINVAVLRWLQSSGLELVFIPSTISAAEAAAYFEHIHGLFLHPGWADDPTYMSLTQAFIRMGVEANRRDYFPIWGTCMGMQMLMTYFGGKLERIHGMKFHVGKLKLRGKSRLLAEAPRREYAPYFNNNYGITKEAFERTEPLNSVFRILGTSVDRRGVEFVSMIEGIDLPFYGVQFHPEYTVPQMNWMLEFLAKELRRSGHNGFSPAGCPVFKKMIRVNYEDNYRLVDQSCSSVGS